MGDLISRQAAIDAICEHGTELERRGITVLAVANHKQVTVDLLESLPSAQPEQRWIPVSERLPETPIRVQVQSDNGWIITAYYDEGKWYAVPDMYWGEPLEGVLAWMPLPEPWGGE